MNHVAGLTVRTLLGALMMVAAMLSPAAVSAQGSLSKSQQSELSKCLTSCKKGDTGCQNSCIQNTTPADYAKSAGSCVRACADALAGPGAKGDQAGDISKCVQACN